MKIFKHAQFIISFIFLNFIFAVSTFAQTTTFTYQGKLNDGAAAANGSYLLEFKLFDAQASGTGTQIGAILTDVPATAVNGIFTVQLDFGANVFNGADRFLEISVRRNASEGYVPLTPRQPVSSVPYAIKSKTAENAATAANADMLDGIDSTGFVPTNTTSFIRNQTSQQTADFNVNGTGTANIFNAATQFNLNGTRILYTHGLDNLFAGAFSGNSSLSGNSNSFFGTNTGAGNTSGTNNSFFGKSAGLDNRQGSDNTFVGARAGFNNTMGNENTFVGNSAGSNNTTGSRNLIFGNGSGTGNTTGQENSFFGVYAGTGNGTGNRNTAVGYNADVGSTNLSYATAIGADAIVGTSNTIALGRSSGADTVLVYGRLQINTLGAAGSTALCRNASNQISTCSSSLRYKTNIKAFSSGLGIVNRLKPITFDWKDGGMKDLGLGAEDVAAVDENLVIRNSNGEVEGVKYDRLGVVLINAVKEQQAQIETQQKLLAEQARQIELLKQLVCSQNSNAGICKEEK